MRYFTLLSFAGAVAAISACAAGNEVACPAPTVEITDSAIVAFIDSVEPQPRRFLIATADYADSALPEPAVRGMGMEGPTYMYPTDPALQDQVEGKLVAAGPFPALLVFYHGFQPQGDTAVDVTFSGRFVSGMYDGQVAPRKSIRMVCGPTGDWQVAKPAPADTTAPSA